MRLKYFLTFFFLLLAPAIAFASSHKLAYRLDQGLIYIYGVAKPQGAEKKTGLEQEMIARNAAIKTLGDHLQQVCDKEKDAIRPEEQWKAKARSLGSTLYPGGILEIEIAVPLNQIFNRYADKSSLPWQLPNGQSVAFEVTNPGRDSSCGVFPLEFADNSVAYILPIGGKFDDSVKVVPIQFNGTGRTLRIGSQIDPSIAQSFKGKSTPSAPIAIPVVTK